MGVGLVVTKLELRYTPGAKWSSRIWAGKGGGQAQAEDSLF